jgi:arabinan endo-1,5-alpha-L-arabinosidase
MRYQNPVWDGYFADPFVLRVADEYYAYGTGGPADNGRQADGRMFPLLHSTDLVHWVQLGGALTPLNDPAKPAYWAPEVAYANGRYYLYYSAGGCEGENHHLRVAVSDSPAGPFEDQGHDLMPDEPFSIDASPFRDPRDGRWYLFFAKDFFDGPRPGTGSAVVPLADDMLHVAGPVTTVLRASADWQIFQRNRYWYGRVWPAWHTVEGPFACFHDGRYYCFYSGGSWETPEYGVGYAVSESMAGPWVEPEEGPVVLRCIPGKVDGPGHNSLVLGPDNETTFMIYHAWNHDRTMRQLCIDPLLWTPNGPRCDGPSTGPRSI